MIKKFMVKTLDSGKAVRKYFKTLNGAMRYFNSCGGAVLYEYDESTFCYEYVDAR